MSSETQSKNMSGAIILDLPIEILLKLTEFLDFESRLAFVSAHTHLHSVFEESAVRRLSLIHVSENMKQFSIINGAILRNLDLSDCWSDSSVMRAVIGNCHELRELNVVNSSLRLEDLISALEDLGELDTLRASFTESGRNVRISSYPSIETAYIEFPPAHGIMNFVASFLDVCPGIKNLHVHAIGSAKGGITSKTRDISADRFGRYERMVLSMDGLIGKAADAVYSHVFNRDRSLPHRRFIRKCAPSHFWFEQRRPGAEPAADELQPPAIHPRWQGINLDRGIVLEEFPDRYPVGTVGLRIRAFFRESMVPRMENLCSLVELDFTGCHATYSVESWRSLANSSPAVEAMALPVCSLFALAGDLPVISPDILDALSTLKLRTLHLELENSGCVVCWGELTTAFAKRLSNFGHLRHLTLSDDCVQETFFSSVENPCSLETLKLKLHSLRDFGGLGGFIRNCKVLQSFVLEVSDLALGSPELWESLSTGTLKELCLASDCWNAISVGTLTAGLPKLLWDLDTFHLHGNEAANIDEVCSFIEEEVRKTNSIRKLNPVRYVDPKLSKRDMRTASTPVFPGRSLCSFVHSVARAAV